MVPWAYADPMFSAGMADGGDPQFYLNADQRSVATAANGKISFTIDQAAAQITRDQSEWGGVQGQAAVVTYAYRADAPGAHPHHITRIQWTSETKRASSRPPPGASARIAGPSIGCHGRTKLPARAS